MAQGNLIIQTTGTLSGLALVNAINDALANVASNASGSTDPSTLTGGVLPYSFWLDTSVSPTRLRIRNGANTAWAECGSLSGTNFVPNLENADIATALGYTPANKAGDAFTGDVSSTTRFDAPIVKATTKFIFSDGSEQTTAATTGFVSGTVMLFVQTTAPTGWVKSTTHNNKALRVVSGTAGSGGSVDFTTAFASQGVSGTVSGSVGNTTLSVAQIPSHTHTYNSPVYTTSAGANVDTGSTFSSSSNTGSQGGGGAHNHPFSGSFSGTSINLAVAYVDAIICVKS